MIRRGPQANPEIKNAQEEHNMELNYNVRGNDRKAMAKLISDTLGIKKTYTGIPLEISDTMISSKRGWRDWRAT